MEEPKRRAPRVHKMFLTAYVNREGEEQKTPVLIGRTVDISSYGAGLEVHQEVAAGSTMELEIDLQDSLLAVAGKVMNVRQTEGDCYLVGIEFDEPQGRLIGLHM